MGDDARTGTEPADREWLLPSEAADCIGLWLQIPMAGVFEVPTGFDHPPPLPPYPAAIRSEFCQYLRNLNAVRAATDGLKAWAREQKRRAEERLARSSQRMAVAQLRRDLRIIQQKGSAGRHRAPALPMFACSIVALLRVLRAPSLDHRRNRCVAWFMIAADVDPTARRTSDGRYSVAHMADRVGKMLAPKNRSRIAADWAAVSAYLAFTTAIAEDPRAVAVLAASTAAVAAAASTIAETLDAALDGIEK